MALLMGVWAGTGKGEGREGLVLLGVEGGERCGGVAARSAAE